ncbi:MAG TPA: hypothetical protein VGG26_06960 [Terracidiphilus sp.]|jgi:hypothetical protein
MAKAIPRGTNGTSCLNLSPGLTSSLDEQIQKLRGQIVERAYARAEERDATQASAASNAASVTIDVSLQDISAAFDEATGQSEVKERRISFFDIFTPFTCICLLLCGVFGFLGLLALRSDPKLPGLSAQASGFLDVAKIFAGALVGSTSSTALVAIKSRKRGS